MMMIEKFTWSLGCGIIVIGNINIYSYIHIHTYNFFFFFRPSRQNWKGSRKTDKTIDLSDSFCCFLQREIFFLSGFLELYSLPSRGSWEKEATEAVEEVNHKE